MKITYTELKAWSMDSNWTGEKTLSTSQTKGQMREAAEAARGNTVSNWDGFPICLHGH